MNRGKMFFSKEFNGKSIRCKSMIKLEDLKGLNIKCCLKLAPLLLNFFLRVLVT